MLYRNTSTGLVALNSPCASRAIAQPAAQLGCAPCDLAATALTLGALDTTSMVAGASLPTIALAGLGAALLYKALFGKRAKERRGRLQAARKKYFDEVQRIREEYR